MRRRLALLMAVLMCVTSVPQSSFLSMAAEETEISTEPMTLAASEEEALEVENVVETEEAIEEIVPETEPAAAEILVSETVMQEPVETESETPEVFETTVPETAETETTETETTETAITEAPTEVITEAPETETSVPETVLPETGSEETEAPETTAPETETESETEGIVVLTGEGEEAAVTNTLEPGQTVDLDFNGNNTVECQYTVPTSGKYCLKFSADSEIWVSVDGLNYGNTKELERDCLLEAGKTYTLQVEKYYSGENDFPVSVSLNETKSIASLNITPGTTAYPKSDGQAWYFRDWKVQVVFTDGSTSNTFGVLDMMCDDETGEMMNPYTSKYNIGVEIYQKDSESAFTNSEYEGDEPWEVGDYQVVFTYPEGRTGRYDFKIASWDDLRTKMELDQEVTLSDSVSYFKFTAAEAGYYLLKSRGEEDSPRIQVKEDDGSDVYSAVTRWQGYESKDIYWFDAGKTYYLEAEKTGENQTLCLSSVENWDPETALSCSAEEDYEFHTFQVKESGKYKFWTDDHHAEWIIYNKRNIAVDVYDSSGELEAGQSYLIVTSTREEDSFWMRRVPQVTAITSLNIRNKDQMVENSTLDWENIDINVSYDDGSTGTLHGMSDVLGNTFSAYFWNQTDEETKYDWDEDLKVGSYTLKVYSSYRNQEISATCDFTVRTVKDLAGANQLTKGESTRFVEAKDEPYVFFQYTAEETGLWDVKFNRSIKNLIVEDEQGTRTTLEGVGNHYSIQMEAGKTVYFVANAGEDWKTLRVEVTKGVAVAKLEIGTDKTYYIGISELSNWDFYIDVTYSDGSTRRLVSDETDGYGNRFCFYTTIDGEKKEVFDIPVDRAEYQIDAYCGDEIKATLQLNCKEIDLNNLPEIKTGEPVKDTGESKEQYYRFTPETDGYYSLAGEYSSGEIYTKENGEWKNKGYKSAKLEKGTTYIFRVCDKKGELLLWANPNITSATSLTLGQPVSIPAGKESSFIVIPEKTSDYRLKTDKSSGGKIYLAIYQKNEETSEYEFLSNSVDQLSYYLEKGKKYLVTVLYEGGTENASLTLVEHVPSKVRTMSFREGDGFPWGIVGIDTPQSLSSHLDLSVGFDDNIDYTIISLYWHQDQLHDGGVLTDEDGTQYTISLKQTTGNNYKLRVTNGDVYVEKELVFVDPDELEVLTEGSSKKISATQADETEKVEIFRFVPTEDGFYKFTAKADGNLLPSVEAKENSVRFFPSYSNDGYQMQKGKTYLVAVTYTRYSTGTITVEASNVTEKAIIDVELEGELPDMNAVEDVCYPDLEGTKLKFIYADGTTEIKTYTWDGEEGIEATANMITSKTCRIRFEAAGYYVEKDIPMLSKAELPVLPGEGMKNVQFSDQGTTKTFSFTAGADGVYQPCITDEKGEVSDFLCRIQEDSETQPEISEDGRGYQLKAGVTYYLVVKAKGSQNISLQKVDAACEHEYVWQTTTEPTCMTAGSRSEICKLCGDVRSTESIPALGHDLTTVIEKNATCGANGIKHVECSRGDYKEASVVIPATGKHTYQTIVDIAATCGSAGSQHEECTVCHTQKAATAIPATGQHQYVEVTDTVPACGSTGTQHKECSICHTRENAETVAATGNHTFTTIVDRAATCGTAGSQHEECTVCHARKEAKAIPATGNHKFKTVVDRAATCGAAGSQHEECTVCHTKKAATAIPATGKHTYGAYETVKEATVFAAGSEERTCSVCGNKESRSIRKLTAKISVSYKSVSVVAGSSVAGPKVTYAKGDKITSWKTSNKTVATVAKNGKITGKKAGTATITVTLKSKKSAKIKVTVKKKVAATRVMLNMTSLTLKKGKSFQLKAIVTPKKTTDKVTYKTSNKKIVTVTSKGKLVAKKKGKATITVTVGKKKAVCRVVVK